MAYIGEGGGAGGGNGNNSGIVEGYGSESCRWKVEYVV